MVQVALGANAQDVSITDSWINTTTNPTGLASQAKDRLSTLDFSYQNRDRPPPILATFIRIPRAHCRIACQLNSSHSFNHIKNNFICTALVRHKFVSNRPFSFPPISASFSRFDFQYYISSFNLLHNQYEIGGGGWNSTKVGKLGV